MNATRETTVYTVPRDHGLRDGSAFEGEMVVGLPADGETLWAPGDNFIHLPSYERDDAEATRLPLPPEMAARLPEFFRTYIMENAYRRPRPFYDCHFFAQWMLGSGHYHNSRRQPVTSRIAEEMIAAGTLSSRTGLDSGELGVLGFKPDCEGDPLFARHSIIGLGRESQRCIQVMGSYKPLVISTCSEAADYYWQPAEVDAAGNPPNPNVKQTTFSGQYGLYLPASEAEPEVVANG